MLQIGPAPPPSLSAGTSLERGHHFHESDVPALALPLLRGRVAGHGRFELHIMEENIETMQDDPTRIEIMLKCQVSCLGGGGGVSIFGTRWVGAKLNPDHKIRYQHYQ